MEGGRAMSTIYVDSWPRQINVHGGILSNPSPEQCREHGYELRTDAMREAERQAAEEASRNAPYEISKLRLVEAFDAIGKLDEFLAFLSSDADMKLYWDTATTLDSDHPMVQAATQSISQAFGLTEEQVDAIMRSARRVGI
jgi:hypothetical protein